MSRGAWEAAAAAFEAFTAINSLNFQVWFSLGCCYIHLNKIDEARAAFARAIAIDPQDADAWANLAAVHCKVNP